MPNVLSLCLIVLLFAIYFGTFPDLDYSWQIRLGEQIVRSGQAARLAAKPAAEPHNWPHVLPGPLPWEPEIDAGSDDEEEDRVGPPGDRAGQGSALAFDCDPPVPGAHLCHEPAHALRALTENAAGIGVGVEGLSPCRDRHWSCRVRRQGDSRDLEFGMVTPEGG